MTELNINRGLSTELFPNGELNAQIIVEEGCWYLCTDTAELFLGLGNGELKRINEVIDLGTGEGGVDPAILEALNAEINAVKESLKNYALSSSIEGLATKKYVDDAVAGIESLEVPTKTSQLTNDSGFLTAQDISGKSDTSHKHDDLYDAKGAAETVKNELLNGAGDAFNTLKELGDLIDANQDAIDALNTIAAGKADREHEHSQYLTTHQDISHLATKAEIPDVSKFITAIPDEYVTETELGNKGFLVESDLDEYAKKSDLPEGADLGEYAKKSDVPIKVSQLTNDSNYLTSVPAEYITEDELDAKGYLTEHQSLTDYALKSEIPTDYLKEIPTEYITEAELNGKGFLVASDLNDYAKTSSIPTSISQLTNDSGYITAADITIPSLDDYATKAELATKAETIHTHTEYAAADHSHSDYAPATHNHDSAYAASSHTHDEYLTEEDLTGYATEDYVTDAIATHAGLSEVKSTLQTVLPTVSEVDTVAPVVEALAKADNIPFAGSEPKIVINSIGGFVAGDDVSSLTVAQLFAKLLGFSLEPSDKPEEPDVPDTPVDPDEPDPEIPKTSEEVVEDIVTQMNTATPEEPVSVMQTIAADGTFAEVKQSEIITFDPIDETSPNAEDAPTKSGFYQIKDETGTIVESGFQEMQIDSGDVYYSIVLPKDIDYNTMITLQAYNSGDGPIPAGWYEIQKYAMLSSRENYDEVKSLCDDMGVTEEQIENIHNADYTLWITEETPNGDKVRYVIN